MSKHNYSQYANKKTNKPAAPVKPVPEVKMVVEPAETTRVREAIETTRVREITEPIKPIEINLVQETVETVTLPKTVEGVVVDCVKLNVRTEPDINADVVSVLDVMSELKIDASKSNDEWFKVSTATGVEGYCMRKFVDAHL